MLQRVYYCYNNMFMNYYNYISYSCDDMHSIHYITVIITCLCYSICGNRLDEGHGYAGQP